MKVIFKGNLTGQPETGFTSAGNGYVTFTVAENHYKQDSAGEWQDNGTTFWRCVSFNESVVAGAPLLEKGDMVLVVGGNKTSEWVNDKGEKRSRLEVVVDELGFNVKSKRFQGARVNVQPVASDGSPF